ncbi:MAG: hypothetical protein JXA90_06710 [Planctomycetes bacterium]|nr:hypothetical protein [Planctomycetota bacterium]
MAAVAGCLAGCGGGPLLQQKDEEISRLNQDLAFKQQMLNQAREKLTALQSTVKESREGSEVSAQQLSAVQRELREYKEKYEQLSVDRVKLEGKSLEWERSYENLRKKLEEVQLAASSTAEELADLRLKSREAATRAERVEASNSSLRDENARLREDLVALNNKLKASEVVLATLKGSSTQPALSRDRERELENQVVTLERETKSMLREKNELLREINALKSKLPESLQRDIEAKGGTALALEGASRGLYYNDPKGLWMETVGFVWGRVEAMVQRRARWDAVDCGVAGFAAVMLLGCIWLVTTPTRWRRRRRLKAEIKRLKARLAGACTREPDTSGEPPVRAPRARRAGSIVRRANQFSPILSAEETSEEEEDTTFHEPEQGFELPDGAFAEAESTPGPSSARKVGGAARGSLVIGARQWDDSDDTDDLAEKGEEEDEFVNTQVIPAMNEFGAEARSGRSNRDPLRRRAPQGVERSPATPAGGAEDEDDGAEEFGNTQIIPGFHEIEGLEEQSAAAAESASPSRRKPSESEDLLSELEDLIGKKVDEII